MSLQRSGASAGSEVLVPALLVADNMHELMELQSLAVKIARSENLPVLPQIASAILKISGDQDTSVRVLEKMIERDPAISAKLLRVANSAQYGNYALTSVGRALSVLGTNTVRSLVIGLAYQQIIGGNQQSRRFSKIAFWQHSLASGVAARIIGKLSNSLNAEELYLAAMVHDVGMLVLERFCPNEFDAASILSEKECLPLHEAERKVLGFCHAEVGGMLAEKWGFGGPLKAGILYHHQPVRDLDHFESTCIVSVASTLAQQAGFNNNSPIAAVTVDDIAFSTVDLAEEQLAVIRDVIASEVARTQEAFQIK